jgi:hypothetical protein
LVTLRPTCIHQTYPYVTRLYIKNTLLATLIMGLISLFIKLGSALPVKNHSYANAQASFPPLIHCLDAPRPLSDILKQPNHNDLRISSDVRAAVAIARAAVHQLASGFWRSQALRGIAIIVLLHATNIAALRFQLARAYEISRWWFDVVLV